MSEASLRGPALSVTIHAGIVALMLLAGTNPNVQNLIRETAYQAPILIAPYISRAHGGGGGSGDRSPLPASKGKLPRIAPRPFTPPLVVRNLEAKLVMEPALDISSDVKLPHVSMPDFGDPFGAAGPKSNGTGKGGGIGDGDGNGIGRGKGRGVGPGEDGDFGGGLRAGGGALTGPVLIYKVEPEFSEEARKAKYQGIVVLYGEVDTNGTLRNIHIVRSLGLGLDDKAVEAVKKWRFRPGVRDGKPVVSAATIEVNFHLL